MFKTKFRRNTIIVALVLSAIGAAVFTDATHSWGGYHWARTANPFTLKLGDNVSYSWDAYLATSSADWSLSSVLDTTVVSGATNPKNCRAVSGRIEVCSSKYGNNGWLGLASIWISGGHIVQGTAKLNDTYFNTVKYNTPAWRSLVMCQEIAHGFGLDHQDTNFGNTNFGTCMDYTSDPDGTLADPDQLSNMHPNAHDYEELEIIYAAHLDTTTTIAQALPRGNGNGKDSDADSDDPKQWGRGIKKDSRGRTSLYERDLGHGQKVFTHVLWAE